MKSLGDDETVDGLFRLGTGYVQAVEGEAVHFPAHEGGRSSADHGTGMVRAGFYSLIRGVIAPDFFLLRVVDWVGIIVTS